MESNFSMVYLLLVYLASVILTGLTSLALSHSSIAIPSYGPLLIALSYIFIIEQFTGKLEPVNENT